MLKSSSPFLVALAICFFLDSPMSAKPGTETFGQFADQPVSKTSLTKALAAYEGGERKAVQLEGRVEKICERKGCWMQLRDGEQTLRVTFKNYGFFVPKSLENKPVLVEGVLKERVQSIAEQKHLLEDAGAPREVIAAVTSEKKVHEFVANAVRPL